MVGYLGRAILTPILQVVYPDKYGVMNGITEAGLRQVGACPLPPTSASFAEQYESINGILLRLAAELEIDLWTLDNLWWKLTSRQAKGPATGSGIAAAAHERPAAAQPGSQRPVIPRMVVLPSGLRIAMEDAGDRLLRFFREEYPYYDGIADAEPDRVLPIDVLATIAMNSRVDDASTGYESARASELSIGVWRSDAITCCPRSPRTPT